MIAEWRFPASAAPRVSKCVSVDMLRIRFPQTSPSRPSAAILTLQSCALLHQVLLVNLYSPSRVARQQLLELGEEIAPTHLGALIELLLIRPEARLLHAQVRALARWREGPCDDALKPVGRP